MDWRSFLACDEATGDRLVERVLQESVISAECGTLPIAICREHREPSDGYLISRSAKLFLQMVGANEVHYPGGKFSMPAGSLGILPARFPHLENRRLSRGLYASAFFLVREGILSFNVLRVDSSGRRMLAQGRRRHGKGELHEALVAELVERAHAELPPGRSLCAGQHFLVDLLGREFALGVKVGESPVVVRCRGIVEAELTDETLTVARLAEELRVHPDHLSRRFHEETGERLKGYIQRQRLQLARELFQNPSFQVAEVGRMVGISDPAYFSRLFRAFTGVSPSAFRDRAGVPG